MVYLDELNEFLKAIDCFVPTQRVAFFRKLEPDISQQLSKTEDRYEYASYQTSGYSGRAGIARLISEEPKSKIYRIKLITYPGVIRASDPSYLQNQMLTRVAFGHKIDIMPRKRIVPSPQLVVISDKGLMRPSINSPEFLTSKMKEEIDAYNTEFERLQMSNNLSFGVQTVPKGARIQVIRRWLPETSREPSRFSEAQRSSMVSNNDFFEFLRVQ